MAFQAFDAAYGGGDDGLLEGLGSRLMERPLEGSDSSGGAYRPWESAERPDPAQQLSFGSYPSFSSPPAPPLSAPGAVTGFATPPTGGSPLPGFSTLQQPGSYPLQTTPRELDGFDERVAAFSAASAAPPASAASSMAMASMASTAATVSAPSHAGAVFSPARMAGSPRHYRVPGQETTPVLTQLESKRAQKRPFE